ncbi:MarR family winged helix-turn-helix transcriptional regulator [Chromobacterium piscinae]|uniref:MarR family winged helix-turn-helix transcriptional regulator n=1 Tax=Chromobacterium piscinae TaxID=686831 RepID=UPI001E4EC5B5|nr:MarR family transcriptional regulator [Chromobacterium piscinae]MCD4503116.1 MarR family transcriptional regulator [Chromobacterium piscinae]MCD5329902.1 MarR family transcriptional regulator [Chromobacterium piscinae]
MSTKPQGDALSSEAGEARQQALARLSRAAYSLSAADARLRGRATRQAGALSLSHARVLRILAEEGALPVARLAELTETTGAGATQLVNGLSEQGYVEKAKSLADKRSVLVGLTELGLARHRERERLLAEVLERELRSMDDQALDAASEVLRALGGVYNQL